MKDFQHQQQAFNRFKDESYGALFHEPGLGKTRTAIELMEHWIRQGHCGFVVVITTKTLMGNWAYVEVPKHAKLDWQIYVWNVTKELPKHNDNKPLLFIINADGICSSKFPEVFKQVYKEFGLYGLVVDESTVFKSMKAARTQMAIRLARAARRRIILSGMPITQSPIDIYSQSELLAPQLLGFKSVVAFRNRYCIMKQQIFGNRRFQQIAGYQHLDELTAKIQKWADVRKKEDCLDLPDKIYRTVPVEFTPEQAQAYKELRTQALTYIEENEVTAVNAVALINKLMQICAGQIKLPNGEYVSVKNNRLDTLKDLVEECPGKTIVWTSFVNTAKDIATFFNGEAVWIPAAMDLEAKQKALHTFRTSKDVKVLIANPASLGHGLTLVESRNVIYYSNSWNYEHRLQSEDRTHRIGQTESVLYTDLITRNTVEERVVKLHQQKKLLGETVITADFLKDLLGKA